MFVATMLAASLVIVTFLFHFWVPRWLSGNMARIAMTAGVRIMVIVFTALAAHLVEVGLYAGAYALGDRVLALGSFGGLTVAEHLDYFYFSIVSYTSLGLGDVFPSDHLRFITGVEALNGLLLITWSGSFIYIAMGRLRRWQPCVEPRSVRRRPTS
jgi:Ion channel